MAFAILDSKETDFVHREQIVKMEIKQFVYKFDGTEYILEEKIIPTHNCTKEDIDHFYPLIDS